MDSLKQKTAKGLLWGALNNGTTQVLNLVLGIFLARLLTPSDYGIVGVLTIFSAIAAMLQSSGLGTALINIKKPTDNDYNAVFWFNILVSLSLYTILFCCAPFIADFFHQPCLVNVSRVLFLSLPISALSISSGTYLIKNMMNREIAIIGISSIFLSGITGIILAYNDFSYWSLVGQQLVLVTSLTIGRFIFVSWRPLLKIDFTPVKRMFSFCINILGTNIILVINTHILTFIFGRILPINTVGYYSQANKWNNMARGTITDTVGQIAQTVFVSVSDEREREIRVFRKMLRFTAFLSFPAMLGFAMVSNEFILLTIGEKWRESIILLQILCMGGAFMPLSSLYHNLIISSGRSDLYMWCNIGQMVIQLILVLLFYSKGIIAIVIAYTILTILWLGVWQIQATRLAGIRLLDVLKDIVPFLVVSLLVMTITYISTANITNLVLLLGARILMAVVLYAGMMKLLRAKVMEECIDFIRKKR
jgi:O-antigen/teichoic acid export membrane protein